MILMKEKLISAGYRITKPRVELLSFFSGKHRPISAQNLSKKLESVDRASVYRALAIFEKLSLVNVDVVRGEKLYCSSEKPHHHIICKQCGYIEAIKCNHNYNKHKNFVNIEHHLTLSGICKNCR